MSVNPSFSIYRYVHGLSKNQKLNSCVVKESTIRTWWGCTNACRPTLPSHDNRQRVVQWQRIWQVLYRWQKHMYLYIQVNTASLKRLISALWSYECLPCTRIPHCLYYLPTLPTPPWLSHAFTVHTQTYGSYRPAQGLTVGTYSWGNLFVVYEISRHVFPTAPSPTTTHFMVCMLQYRS